MSSYSMLTDLYQLTMLSGYFQSGKHRQKAAFDLYFRRVPVQGGFCVAAGLEPALEYLTGLRFDADDIAYLASLELFQADFLEWLADFRFQGDVWAVPEGELVFPNEPMLKVEGTLAEAQIVESTLLNLLNFQTLIATRAARLKIAARGAPILEFGLRRAQGPDGAMSASRAAYIGGCDATSNTLAGQRFDIPVKGTHAHSWVMSFSSELEAFRAYAKAYPDSCILLVDTYDTLEIGVPNAITVGRELRRQGHELKGIRLDSGDLALLSKKARQLLDEAGFPEVAIVASNDLDEQLIDSLLQQGARIDIWGVGTNLVTSRGEPALGGVYKLAAVVEDDQWVPRIKLSGNPVKTTIPARKQVWRAFDGRGRMLGDVLSLLDEEPRGEVKSYDPLYAGQARSLSPDRWEPMLKPAIRSGTRVVEPVSLHSSRELARRNLESLAPESRRRLNPERYWVGLAGSLHQLRNQLIDAGR